MQTAEAETATPDQLRRGATLIVTFPLWPLHFPSIPAFNPSGGVGRARRKQSATAAPQGGKRKERKKEKKIPNPKHTPPLRSPPLSNPSSPPPHHQSPTRFAGCARPPRPRPLRFTGGGGVRERAPATGEEGGGGDGAARGQQVPPRAEARERLVRGDLPRFVPPLPALWGGFRFFGFFFFGGLCSLLVSLNLLGVDLRLQVLTCRPTRRSRLSWWVDAIILMFSHILQFSFPFFFLGGGGGRRGSQLVDWGGSDG